SDDFAGGGLDPVWTVVGPSGTSSSLGTNATDGYLSLLTPDGNHDIWGTNNSVRAMQAAADDDFEIETRFLTTPSAKYQMQGLLIEEDAQNWLRFDTYSDGKKLYAFAAITVDGVSSQALRVAIPGGTAPYLRVERIGDNWQFDYSLDGNTWTSAGSFTHALEVSAAGVFAGNTGPATGFTAQVDYVEFGSDPLLDEDGTILPVNTAPEASDDSLTTDSGAALLFTSADLLANDSDADGDALNLVSVTQPG
ncbi:DUF1349 domain-containing protein, partial [Frigidibacter sp. ROC022]|uniref:beta-xylosidase family glycoside hydrolase n=1 Tax=Frigidibacter sp. ROC022 TaxID=2971796 RepID=UPI00215B6498